MKNVIEELERLEGIRWTPIREPASDQSLAALERTYGQTFPEDFRRIYRRFGGGELVGKGDSLLVLEHVGNILEHSRDPALRSRLPGAVVIAGDGGDKLIFYDAENRLGRGSFAVFLGEWGALSQANLVYVGATISEVIEKTLTIGDLAQD
jgi:SMI1 / KNR4 family (SUKH-1)